MTYCIQATTPAGACKANNGTINDLGTAVPLASIKTLQDSEYPSATSQILLLKNKNCEFKLSIIRLLAQEITTSQNIYFCCELWC